MLSSLHESAPSGVAFCLTYLIHSTLVIAAVWLIARFVKDTTSRDHLWKWALIAPCLTAAIQLVFATGFEFSLNRETEPDVTATSSMGIVEEPEIASEPMLVLEDPSHIELLTIDETSLHESPAAITDVAVSPVEVESYEPPPLPAETKPAALPLSSAAVLMLAIACVSLLLLARSAYLELRLHRWLKRRTTPDTGVLHQTVVAFTRRQSVKRRVCVATADVVEPCSLGVFQWVVVLPRECHTKLSADELEALIGHELAHLVNRDPVWLRIGRLIGDAFWFQPLNRLVANQVRTLSEFRSDEWATSHNVCPLDLARCLASVAEWASNDRPRPLVSTATGRASTLSRRIEQLVDDARSGSGPNRNRAVVTWLTVCTLAMVTTLPRASCATGRNESLPATDEISAASEAEEPTRSAVSQGSIDDQLVAVSRDIRRVQQLLSNERDAQLQKLGESLNRRLAQLQTTVSTRAKAQPVSQGEER